MEDSSGLESEPYPGMEDIHEYFSSDNIKIEDPDNIKIEEVTLDDSSTTCDEMVDNDSASVSSSVTSSKHTKLKRKRKTNLTMGERLKIIEQIEAGRKRNLICKEYGMVNSTLTTILNSRDQIRFALKTSSHLSGRKRVKVAKSPELEEELWVWYQNQKKKGHEPIGPDLCGKAVEIAARTKNTDFKPTSGWLCRFKARKGIYIPTPPKSKSKRHEPDEQISSAEPSSVNIIQEAVKEYNLEDIFTVGETSLFYRCTPEKVATFLNEDCSDGRFSNDRLTILAATNVPGTEKLPLLVIGKFSKPRYFRGLKTIPTEYMANPKAWMIPSFFEQWVKKLDTTMVSQNRKIKLCVSRSAAHPDVQNLQNVSLSFMPASSNCHPMSQGILQTLKQNYRRSMIQRRLHFSEVDGPQADCDINMLDAMHWLRAAWKDVSPGCIYKSFQNAGCDLPAYETYVCEQPQHPSSVQSSTLNDSFHIDCNNVFNDILIDAEYLRLFEQLSKSLDLDPFITAEIYSTLDDNVPTSGHLTDEELKESVCNPIEVFEENKDKECVSPSPAPPPSFLDAKQCLYKLSRYFAQEKGTEQQFDTIAKLHHNIREIVSAGARCDIIDIFSDQIKDPRGGRKHQSNRKPKLPLPQLEVEDGM